MLPACLKWYDNLTLNDHCMQCSYHALHQVSELLRERETASPVAFESRLAVDTEANGEPTGLPANADPPIKVSGDGPGETSGLKPGELLSAKPKITIQLEHFYLVNCLLHTPSYLC